LEENHTNHNPRARLILGFVSFLLIGVGLGLWYSNQSDDEAPTDTDSVTQIVDPSINIVEEGATFWSDTLIASLKVYDETNDNVFYLSSSDTITIESNGIPDHETGDFPNSGNPNTISEQDQEFTFARSPIKNDTPTDVQIFGVAKNGVLFEPGTAERDQASGWSIEAFNTALDLDLGIDLSNAHVQPTGTYHYHGIPEGLLDDDGTSHSSLVGFAADGFPIYARYGYSDISDANSPIIELQPSWQLKTGQRGEGEPNGPYSGDYTNDFEFNPFVGDLDECNGIFTVTPEFPGGTYAYFLTDTFPFAPRCIMGIPDASFSHGDPGGGQLPPPQGGPR